MKEVIKKIRFFLEQPKNRKVLGIAVVIVVIIAGIFIVQHRRMKALHAPLYIDTVASSMDARVARIALDQPYYNKKVSDKTKSFYQQHNYKTKWLEYKAPNKHYNAFLDAVETSDQHGLRPEFYNMQRIEQAVDSLYNNPDRTHEQLTSLDIKITATFFLFTTHIIEGRIRTAGYGDFVWQRAVPKEDEVKLLVQQGSRKLTEIIEHLHPPYKEYEQLRKALQQYRGLEQYDSTSYNPIRIKGPIKPRAKHPAIPLVRKRLFLTDIKPYPVKRDTTYYDDTLLQGVKQFQARHGLVDDGVINEETLKYINQSFREKADLIELNLERLRWLPSKHAGDYISINIPEYMLRVYHNKKRELEMKVVLGTEFNATPIFNDSLEYIVFSPTWNVPPGIMKDEVIPNLKEDPAYYNPERFVLYKNGEEIDPEEEDWKDKDLNPAHYQLVERPGPSNSLGKVKFIMPNDLSIYLHDTPAGYLFSEEKRTYSHGCIRIEKPMALAQYLLRDQPEWTEKKIKEVMTGTEPKQVNLKQKCPVEIEYRTVWVDDKGLVHFRNDVYGHDKRQLDQLRSYKLAVTISAPSRFFQRLSRLR